MRACKLHKAKAARAIALSIQAAQIVPDKYTVAAQQDIATFGKRLTGLDALTHHQEWLKAIQTNYSSEALNLVAGKNLRIAAPRGGGKTTWAMIAIAWIIGNNPGIRIILTSYAEEIAIAISLGIKSLIESSEYRQVFPTIRASKRWADGKWWINRKAAGVTAFIKDPTLLAVGMEGAIGSRRSDLIIIEDPIKSSKAIANPNVRTAMVTWWSEVINPTRVKGGRAICFCTRYRSDDIHGTTFTEAQGWQVIVQQAIVIAQDGSEKSYCEKLKSIEELKAQREENPQAFSSQMMNNPIAESVMIIKPEWIKSQTISSYFEAIVLGVDLAASEKESADYTAIVAVGRDRGPKGKRPGGASSYQITDARRGRWSIHQIALEIFKTYNQWQGYCDRIVVKVEEKALQVAFIREFKRLAIEMNLLIVIEGDKHQGSKEQRLRGVSGLFEAGLVTFNLDRDLSILKSELVSFNSTPHDDLADACEIALRNCYKTRKRMTGGSY